MVKKYEPEEKRYCCPFCDEAIVEATFPYCKACEVTILYCPKCRKAISRENRVCPYCEAEIKG